MSKSDLSEHDICTKYITPAVNRGGWAKMMQMCEEVSFVDLESAAAI
jgi:type I restriction enzyme R subunit